MNEVVVLLQQVSRSSWRCRESSRWNDVERKGEKYKNQKHASMHQLWLAKAMNEVVGLPQGGRGSDDVRGCKMSCTAVADYFLPSLRLHWASVIIKPCSRRLRCNMRFSLLLPSELCFRNSQSTVLCWIPKGTSWQVLVTKNMEFANFYIQPAAPALCPQGL